MPTSPLPSDLAIARAAHLEPIAAVAEAAGIPQERLEPYGRHVAKIDLAAVADLAGRPRARYVVITAITPTPLGEGKTTTAVGLAQGLSLLGHRADPRPASALDGPDLRDQGRGGRGRVQPGLPMETLNLHLTGDFHAVTAAHNLLAAMVDNHLHHGNELGLDPRSIAWRRVARRQRPGAAQHRRRASARRIDGVPRQTGFDITAASEVMVILGLATSLRDLRERLGRIVVGYTPAGEPVTAEDLKAAGAMAVMLEEALKPNLLQTTENTPVLVHTGPFGNIATGNSSVVADQIGIHAGDYLLTEAGFGSDMGAERFFNLKCRVSGLQPDAAVLVATVRSLKAHSGHYEVVAGRPLPKEMLAESPGAVRAGADNLRRHIEIVRSFGVSPVVAVNAFPSDLDSEHEVIREVAEGEGARVAVSTHVVDGGKGARSLAEAVAAACGEEHEFQHTYELDAPLREKIEAVATRIYGADGVDYSATAAKDLERFEVLGYGAFPVVIAKTHLSLSSDPTLRGAPRGWRMPVREVRAAAGAGYVYAISGEMRTMPGLPRNPAAAGIDLDDDGEIVGLF